MNDHKTPQCPPWAIRAWPPILWQLTKSNSLPLQHLCTQVSPANDPAFRSLGQTLWAASCQHGRAAMAWDWVELSEGVFAMVDPMAIVTNLRLVDDQGEPLPSMETARHINGIVHGLPWQQAVEQAISQSPQTPGETRDTMPTWFVPRAMGHGASVRVAGTH
ncbi:hypothetical protein [Aquabacterium sp. OR-4]|uniref:hypothetical protein n=1 Tax=Aquabacterium sp. OR-4 TaxID=2978127 RepID=UPI0021B433AD|nr:hypothetical protein [Aquabacterium sp. OR-4]MDT7833788.1 hypothetical protein [Aquabacterium sp. OR-4]